MGFSVIPKQWTSWPLSFLYCLPPPRFYFIYFWLTRVQLTALSVLEEMWPFLPDCCFSIATLSLAPCNPMDFSIAGSFVFHYYLEFAQIHIHWVGAVIQPSHLLPPPATFVFSLSNIRYFSSLRIRWPKYWRSNFNNSPSSEHSE